MPDPVRQRPLRILPAGDRALLVAVADRGDLAGFVDRLRRELPDGVEDIIPAAETVLLTLTAGTDPVQVRPRLGELFDQDDASDDRERADDVEAVSIEVRYDGADLEQVAAQLGLSVAEVVAAHTGCDWRCAFMGFAPGFGYLESPESGLQVARRTESRTRVPAGAVALADGYSAVYPRSTPGGWQLIGTTEVAMWDLSREQPALLQPGVRVRFVDRDAT